MSGIEKIMGRIEDILFSRLAIEQTDIREMITTALAEARRDGAEQMQAAAFDACVMQANADRVFAKSERNAGAADCAADLTELIRALPLPIGPSKAVRLTDDRVREIAYQTGCFDEEFDITGAQTDKLCRAIETAVLAANGLGDGNG
jgi:hypothetical protein